MLESIVSFDKSKNFDLVDEGMMIPEEELQCTKTSGEREDGDDEGDFKANVATSTPMKN